MPSFVWLLVFFSGWPLSGGNGATSTDHGRPSLPPSRDGCFSEEGVRDIQNIHRKHIEGETAAGLNNDGDHSIALESVMEEEHEENAERDCKFKVEDDDVVCQEVQKAGVVQKMVRKFSRRGMKQMPLLVRRNTVARCTNFANDVGKSSTLQQSSQVIWDDDVTGADAATDHEFSSLMKRVNDIKLEGRSTIKEDSVQGEISSLSRGSASRMSLPSGALKSYMRSTKASVMKTRENSPPCAVETNKNLLASKSSQTSQVFTSPSKRPSTSKGKTHTSSPEGVDSLPRRKGVVVKPNIPPVLLKGINKMQKFASSSQATNKCSEGQITVPSAVSTEKDSLSVYSKIESKEKSQEMAASLPHHLLSGQCQDNCSQCSLVDLWFTIWHVEFHKK